ncbi:hypothetical protein [Mycolicibacterium sp. CH28]|uniref:hypothetical protein n=1 Tax=Mycolicibacterium sp. CH28 TaxID=2512237 RepID=UPI0019120B57|nr:hypothetical protein [Mycolicibacterium sp. CH28]
MLVNQQVQSIPAFRETHREIDPTMNGAGVAGTLGLELADELGCVQSLCRSEITATTEETLVAQFTVTAMRDSPANLEEFWLSVGVMDRGAGGRPTTAPVSVGRDGS